ncbi:MAG: hypothetical protein AAFU63_07270 [Pseudomonadota bacterium]
MTDTPILVWDFDGVLNANTVDGRFVWADRLAQDWGVDKDVHPDAEVLAHLARPDLRHVIGTNN